MQQLKTLAEKGFTVVGIHPPGTPTEEIEKLIGDRKLPYATLLATDNLKDPNGPKLGGYPAGVFPYCVLVDGQGRVAAHGLLSEITSAVTAASRLAKLSGKSAPGLEGSEWFNAKSPLKLEEMKGKVVLLDFWGQWCGPCVAKLPEVETLHAKFKDRGLVVIGVHSNQDSEKLDEFLKEKKVTFPVMIDRGESAERYLVDAWPRYYLLNKSGEVVWGGAHEPPSAAQIEDILSAKE